MTKCPNCKTDLKVNETCAACGFTNHPLNLKVNQIFAFVAVDKDGNEAIPAIRLGDMAVPMLGADLARINSLRPYAEKFRRAGANIKLRKFTSYEEIEFG